MLKISSQILEFYLYEVLEQARLIYGRGTKEKKKTEKGSPGNRVTDKEFSGMTGKFYLSMGLVMYLEKFSCTCMICTFHCPWSLRKARSKNTGSKTQLHRKRCIHMPNTHAQNAKNLIL